MLVVRRVKWPAAAFVSLIIFLVYSTSVLKNVLIEHRLWLLPKSRSVLTGQINRSLHIGNFTNVNQYTRYTSSRLGLAPLQGTVALRPEFGQVLNDVDFNYSIQPSYRCLKKSHLFIVVISAPGNRGKRDLIRQTWIRHMSRENESDWSVNYAFMVGLHTNSSIRALIGEESSVNRDIIQADLTDTYMNLTLKSVAFLHWSHRFCPNAEFILKCDDDVYVNVQKLKFLTTQLPRNVSRIYGTASVNLKPVRTPPNDKWTVGYETWPWSSYPPYVSGGAYLIDGSAVGSLLAAAQTVPYFPYEDVYINGLCARKASVQLWSSDLMLNYIQDSSDDLLVDDAWLLHNAAMWLTVYDVDMVASHLAAEVQREEIARSRNKSLLTSFEWTALD